MALDPDALRAAKRESAERRRHVNREKIIERTRARQREMKQFIIDGKRRPCTDCGLEYPPFAMDYDHVPELGEKKYGIASLHKRGSWPLIHDELAKCEVVCAVCHRLRTYSRGIDKDAD